MSEPGTVARSTGTLRAVVLLVHAADAPPDSDVALPTELVERARSWYRTVSYGKLDLALVSTTRWLALPATSAQYVAEPARYLRDAVAAADAEIDFAQVDVVYLAPSTRTPSTTTFALLNGFGVRADGHEIRLWVPLPAGFADAASTDPWLLLHETGHLLGLPDLYSRGAPATFHRWDVMAARYPAGLLAWHRWKLGWLEQGEIVCISQRGTRVTTVLSPVERPRGRKAVFVRRGARVLAVEVRARIGYDATQCDAGVLVYEVDQTPFRAAPIRIHAAQSDRDPPRRGCPALWNAPFDVGRNERRTLRLDGFRVDVLARRSNGDYRLRVTG